MAQHGDNGERMLVVSGQGPSLRIVPIPKSKTPAAMKYFYFVNVFLALVFSLLTAAAIGFVGLYAYASRELPSITKIKDYNPSLVTTVYANDGQVLGYLYREKRFLVQLDEVPEHLRQAFLASEDSAFYEHEGLDLTAIARAFVMNLKSGEIVQGGSTITQQIIKQLLLSTEKKYERKLKEAILSYQLENFLTKDEIFTIYLNQVFFGAGAYGVEAAARTYFGKHVGDITLAEAAVLAGLPKAPSNFNPFHYPEMAKGRQRYVLRQMLQKNWITQEQYDQALAEELVYKTMPEPTWKLGAYYLEEVRRWLIDYLDEENMRRQGIVLDRYGEDAVYESGLHVYTAVDLEHQEAGEKALREGLSASTKRRGWRGADFTLTPAEYSDFLRATAPQSETLQAGEWVQALVLDVQKDGALVLVGEREGWITAQSMRWTRHGSPRSILAPGEVVWTTVEKDPLRLKHDKPKTTAEKRLVLNLEQWPKVQGCIVSMDPRNGRVLALVGGFDFRDSQFNRATQARRQPGSSFKPIVFSLALDSGYTPRSVVYDSPISFGNWSPKNYGSKFSGPTTVENALVKSKNVVTVRIAAHLGIKNVIKRSRDLGLEGEFPPYLPISLGAQALRPINLVQAYSAFARDGSYIKPRFVLSIKRAWGEEIFRSAPEPVPAIASETAFKIARILQQAVQRGTGVRAKVLQRPVAGKTGTTNDEIDAWFIGFSPYLLSGVYVGFDQLTPMGRSEAGSRAALPIWLSYRLAVEPNYAIEDFAPPPELKLAEKKSQYWTGDGNRNVFGDPMASTAPDSGQTSSSTVSVSSKINRGAATNDELLKNLY
jgi:penicillin-binding protein 1A